MSRTLAVGLLVVQACVLTSGCRTVPRRPAAVKPRIIEPDLPLRRLAAWKQDGQGDIVFALVHKNTKLPAEAAPISPMLARAFGVLRPSGIFYYPQRVRERQYLPSGDPDFNAELTAEELRSLLKGHTRPDGTVPAVALLRVSAHYDQDVFRVRKNATVRGLVEAWGGYIEPSADFEVEESASELTITLAVQAPTSEMTSIGVQIKADVHKQAHGSGVALFIHGSGGKISKDIVLTQGLGSALEVCVARAVLTLCSELLDVDYARFLAGEIPSPQKRRPSPRRLAPSPSAERPPEPTPQAGPKELILQYEIRTRTGHAVEGHPAVLRTGDRFYLNVTPSEDCAVYLLAENATEYALLHPRSGDGSASLVRGRTDTIPSRGSFALDADASLESMIIVISAKPITAFEDAYAHSGAAAGAVFQTVARRIVQTMDHNVMSRTETPRGVQLRWALKPGLAALATRILIDHR